MMKPASFAVLFRTHVWDAFARVMAGHLAEVAGRGDLYILADETNGTLDTEPYRKITHTVEFADLGLDVGFPHKERFLWYNGDFPLYRALITLPNYDYYYMVEYDVLITRPLDPLTDKLAYRNIEAVGFRLEPAPPGISEPIAAYFSNANSLLPSVFVASRRVVEYLFQARRRIAELYSAHPERGWPFCEAFLGAAITDRPDIAYADLGQFGDVSRYEFWPPSLYDPKLLIDHRGFIHPVLDAERFARLRSIEAPHEFFIPNSALRHDLERVSPRIFVPALRRIFQERGQRDNLTRLRAYLRTNGLKALDEPFNIGLGCPATQSSLSPWSAGASIAEEAGRALEGALHPYPNVHIGPEDGPWWAVDLQTEFEIESMHIYNRSDRPELAADFRRFSIYSSDDGELWTLQYRKDSDEIVGGDAVRPFVIDFLPPFIARHIRVQNDGSQMIHITRFEIYGYLPDSNMQLTIV